MNPNSKKDYFAGVTTTLTPYRHTAVKEIANRLCWIRDHISGDSDYCSLEINDKYHTIWLGYKSNSQLYEIVAETLPRILKGKTVILVSCCTKKRCTKYKYSF